jgi:hypothetical protein
MTEAQLGLPGRTHGHGEAEASRLFCSARACREDLLIPLGSLARIVITAATARPRLEPYTQADCHATEPIILTMQHASLAL